MGRSPILLAATLKRVIIYCEAKEARSNCVCSPGEDVMSVLPQIFPDVRLNYFSTEGSFLVSETNNHRHEKVDVKRVTMEIQENVKLVPAISLSGPLGPSLWRPGMRVVEATFFRHLYRKCDFCTYFTSDLGASRYQCPHCSRSDWALPGLYIAKKRTPEQPMHSVWYRSAPASYMVTDDLESYPLSQHKEMCHTSEFLSKLKFRDTDEYTKIPGGCLSPNEVSRRLQKWEDGI